MNICRNSKISQDIYFSPWSPSEPWVQRVTPKVLAYTAEDQHLSRRFDVRKHLVGVASSQEWEARFGPFRLEEGTGCVTVSRLVALWHSLGQPFALFRWKTHNKNTRYWAKQLALSWHGQQMHLPRDVKVAEGIGSRISWTFIRAPLFRTQNNCLRAKVLFLNDGLAVQMGQGMWWSNGAVQSMMIQNVSLSPLLPRESAQVRGSFRHRHGESPISWAVDGRGAFPFCQDLWSSGNLLWRPSNLWWFRMVCKPMTPWLNLKNNQHQASGWSNYCRRTNTRLYKYHQISRIYNNWKRLA